MLKGALHDYDWLHLHHEDFTGQYSKFFLTFTGKPWLGEMVQFNTEAAKRLGFRNVPALKKAVARPSATTSGMADFCSQCAPRPRRSISRSPRSTPISRRDFADGTPIDPAADSKLDWSRSIRVHWRTH